MRKMFYFSHSVGMNTELRLLCPFPRGLWTSTVLETQHLNTDFELQYPLGGEGKNLVSSHILTVCQGSSLSIKPHKKLEATDIRAR